MLVADDDPAIRTLVRVAVAAQDWRVIEATTPAEAIALSTLHQPDVLLLDVNFEGQARDGYAVCREIKATASTKDVRVVLFTARDDPESRAFASAVGATAFIVKPFGPLDLVQLLRVVLEHPAGDPALGLYLIDAGVIRPAQLERALAAQRHQLLGEKVRLGEILVRLGFATALDVQRALGRQQRARQVLTPGRVAPQPLRVVIADDNRSVVDGLRELFATQADLSVVGVAFDGVQALQQIRDQRPDAVVLDHEMPRLQGLDVLRSLQTEMPEVAVVMFTLDDSIREAALAYGARAVVTKDTPLAVLMSEIRGQTHPIPQAPLGPRSMLLTTQRAGRAWGVMARRKRTVVAIAILLVLYAGGFLLSEPAIGASASLIAIPVVALCGALLGPEAGMVLAMLSALESVVLWQATNHAIGEPILRVGGNGLGVIALIGIGAGFGAMRQFRGRLNPRARRVSAIAEAALALSGGLDPTVLGLLAESALEVVPGDAALLFVPVPGGGLEIVAAAGADRTAVGTRLTTGLVARVHADRGALVVDALDDPTIKAAVPGASSGVFVPMSRPGDPSMGVLAIVSTRRHAFDGAHLPALTTYGAFLASLLITSPAYAAIRADTQPQTSATSQP